MFSVRIVACIGSKETDSVVPPVFQKLTAIYGSLTFCFVKFKNWHQFYCINTQIFQIGNFFPHTWECTSVNYIGRFIHCKSSDMKLIDNQIFHWNKRLPFRAPIKIVAYYPGVITTLIVRDTPIALPGYSFGIRIQKNTGFIKNKTLFWIIGTIYTVSIFEIFDL